MIHGQNGNQQQQHPNGGFVDTNFFMLHNVISTTNNEQQRDHCRPNAKEMFQALGKKQSHIAYIKPQQTTNGNQTNGHKNNADNF